jgi:hypothetical protein
MNIFDTTLHPTGTMADGKATGWVVWITEYDPTGKVMVAQLQDLTLDQAANLCSQLQRQLAMVQGYASGQAQGGAATQSTLGTASTLSGLSQYLSAGPAGTPEAETAATEHALTSAAGGLGGELVEGLGSAAIEALLGV